MQVQGEAIKAAKLRVEMLFDCFYFAVIFFPSVHNIIGKGHVLKPTWLDCNKDLACLQSLFDYRPVICCQLGFCLDTQILI